MCHFELQIDSVALYYSILKKERGLLVKYAHVCIEAFGYALPPRVVSSEELEDCLAPLYSRLGLCKGRLELMSGIRRRRFWEDGFLPSQAAALAGEDALRKACIDRHDIQCLINCSVSRDFVEPATSTAVHRLMGLGDCTLNFDISNACLGMSSAIQVLANMVELGQIDCGMAVCGENAGPLVANTVARLNSDDKVTRQRLKGQFASLTIGSCAAAAIVTSAEKSHSMHRLLATASYCDTSSNGLCQGNTKGGGMTDGSAPAMETDSQELLRKGVSAAQHMWQRFKQESGWNEGTPDVFCTHQVGKAHSALLFETLGIDTAKDYRTFPGLGNCGSASWPVTCALAEENGKLKKGDKLAVLAIGSGINCDGMALLW